MPVPSTQEIYKPLLEAFNVEAPISFAINDFLKYVADSLGQDINAMSSNEKNTFRHNIINARNFLRQKNLIANPTKTTYEITDLGREVLNDNPEIISEDYLNALSQKEEQEDFFTETPEPELEQEPELEPEQELEDLTALEPEAEEDIILEEEPTLPEPEPEPEELTPESEPEEIFEPEPDPEPEPEPEPEPQPAPQEPAEFQTIEDAIAKHNAELSAEVLSRAAALPSDMFEVLVIDLLSKMGYRAFQNARYNSDANEFIQGVILDDKPANPIYIHAKRLSPDKTIGRADMQDFIDSLADKGGKGIFATTANFSEQAVISANDERIMLIDGQKLASLMINHNFCVNTEKVFEVKAIDLESFSEYE